MGPAPCRTRTTLAAECFDERIQALATIEPSTAWWDARRDAQRRATVAAAAQELRSQS